MNEPIKAGDQAEVIGGLGQGKSPNLGLIVTVESARGEHSRFGRIWRCNGDGVKQLGDAGDYVDSGWADFPADWLRKLPPEAGPMARSERTESAPAAKFERTACSCCGLGFGPGDSGFSHCDQHVNLAPAEAA